MKKKYFAPVFGPRHELLRYAGATVEATPPQGSQPRTSADGKTGRRAAFDAISASLSDGERILKRTVRSLG